MNIIRYPETPWNGNFPAENALHYRQNLFVKQFVTYWKKYGHKATVL